MGVKRLPTPVLEYEFPKYFRRNVLFSNFVFSHGRFDAVVMESMFSECQWSLLPGRLRLPAVYVVPTSLVDWMPMDTGSPAHPSYLGALLVGYPTPNTFCQRLQNTVVYVHANLVRWYRDASARADDLHRRRWPTARDSIMVLVNTHHSVEPARPLGPNVREIGGIHLRRPIEHLPPVSKVPEMLYPRYVVYPAFYFCS